MGYENMNFSENRLFLVTGAAGFIGSNLVEALLNKGMRVRALDNFATGKKENIDLFRSNINFEFIEGDICNFETCQKACVDVDYVLHQAALGSVPRSIKLPILYEEFNIKGTLNMMEAARLTGTVKRFVYASSSSVYGDSVSLPKLEGDEGFVLSPYAVTKAVNENYGSLYTRLYGLPCIGLRYFNVFGRRQDPDSQYAAVIPKFVKILMNGQAPIINGDGEQSRDFTYIENVIEANLKSCIAPENACGEAFNIAYGEKFTVNQMYVGLCNELGVSTEAIFGPERAGDIRHSLADISKARRLLNYQPSWDFKSGFKEAVSWYSTYLSNRDE
ncbi:SDR family oxidoreductase [Paenibacillus agricola]|uniref:SDR family oxidoreductase n=1 Tax=Paenibacillus agricola TaxID=2716264 RepID=A0ABX0JCX6_9BACL|nr:SDR family oxidoreductase [Paenibacillus agricola]NHN34325.1 SDR family oxidoreductase [Paenibacillus agricola]